MWIQFPWTLPPVIIAKIVKFWALECSWFRSRNSAKLARRRVAKDGHVAGPDFHRVKDGSPLGPNPLWQIYLKSISGPREWNDENTLAQGLRKQKNPNAAIAGVWRTCRCMALWLYEFCCRFAYKISLFLHSSSFSKIPKDVLKGHLKCWQFDLWRRRQKLSMEVSAVRSWKSNC